MRILKQLEFWFYTRLGICDRCDAFLGLRWSMTGSADPKAAPGFWLCQSCDEEHQDYWEEMWDDYYSGMV